MNADLVYLVNFPNPSVKFLKKKKDFLLKEKVSYTFSFISSHLAYSTSSILRKNPTIKRTNFPNESSLSQLSKSK